MGSFQRNKWSDSKRCSVKVRWGIFIENLTAFFLLLRAIVNIPIQSLIISQTLISQDDHLSISKSGRIAIKTLVMSPWLLLCEIIISKLELAPPVVKRRVCAWRSISVGCAPRLNQFLDKQFKGRNNHRHA